MPIINTPQGTPDDLIVAEHVRKIETAQGEDRENILLLLKEDFINMNQDGIEGPSEAFGLTRKQFDRIFSETGNEMTFKDLISSAAKHPPITHLNGCSE